MTDIFGSTEDAEIEDEFQRLGCTTIKRPATLANDEAPIIPVIKHTIECLKEKGKEFDWIMLLQTTCPFRSSFDIDNVVNLINEKGCDSVLSVYKVEDNHPSRMYKIENNRLVSLYPENNTRRRQDLEPVYHRNGAIYACKIDTLYEINSLISADVYPYIMPQIRSFNIDNELDLFIARQVYNLVYDKKKNPNS